jgi:hypothetical protein
MSFAKNSELWMPKMTHIWQVTQIQLTWISHFSRRLIDEAVLSIMEAATFMIFR